MTTGIYQIKNIINDKIYIGSAVNLYKRKIDHFSTLVKNTHHNNYLQKSYNKYGKDAFTFEVLFTCPKKDLIRLEQYHINNYNPEYNICRIAGSILGIKRSEETKLKMSKSQTGKKHSEETKKKQSLVAKNRVWTQEQINARLEGIKNGDRTSKPIIKMDLDNNFIKLYISATEAEKECSVKRNAIVECLKGRNKSAGGFKWKYKYD